MSLSYLSVAQNTYAYVSLQDYAQLKSLPYSQIILAENLARRLPADKKESVLKDFFEVVLEHKSSKEIEFLPARVLLTDFTGVPCMVDFAAMRDALSDKGKDPARVNPLIPTDLVIDHSVIADTSGCPSAAEENARKEFERNKERYSFLKWAQQSFKNLRIIPPDMGICHQLNLELLSSGVFSCALDDRAQISAQLSKDLQKQLEQELAQGKEIEALIYPDSLMGADSHTTTVNGISVLSWGVGGIEAEAAMLGQASSILIPRTIGIKLIGKPSDRVSAMDIALSFAERLRALQVVSCFVECFGPGLEHLSANDRATIANMSPEYGCTACYFPFDDECLAYYRRTGRSDEQISLIEAYAKTQQLWHDPDLVKEYDQLIEFDLSSIEPSLSGPSRPHDRIALSHMKERFHQICEQRGLDQDSSYTITLKPKTEFKPELKHGACAGLGQDTCSLDCSDGHAQEEESFDLSHGALAIAAITSCTTTANPDLILSAGLLAKKAVEAGLETKPWIKRMWSPGSAASEQLLVRSGLKPYFEKLGFYTAGFGCMSCIGNSGPLSENMQAAGKEIELCAVLSGNRNFEGRIGPDISQNYLASPALVIAYALVGTVDFDFESQALAYHEGKALYLRDIMPSKKEVEDLIAHNLNTTLFSQSQDGVFKGTQGWQELECSSGLTYDWDESSTYIRKPPYFEQSKLKLAQPEIEQSEMGQSEMEQCGLDQSKSNEHTSAFSLNDAAVLLILGDFVTTDHISPAGSIALDSPAAQYLLEQHVGALQFNTYGSRRGNHELMMRGTFANIKLKNDLAQGKLGPYTRCFVSNPSEVVGIWSAACAYAQSAKDLVVLAGKMYGSGSSRDWAAKGPALLGVKAVLAESFERIHRSNLVGMGIVPLEFLPGQSKESLGLHEEDSFSLEPQDWTQGDFPRKVKLQIRKADASIQTIELIARVDTAREGLFIDQGGIMPYMLNLLSEDN